MKNILKILTCASVAVLGFTVTGGTIHAADNILFDRLISEDSISKTSTERKKLIIQCEEMAQGQTLSDSQRIKIYFRLAQLYSYAASKVDRDPEKTHYWYNRIMEEARNRINAQIFLASLAMEEREFSEKSSVAMFAGYFRVVLYLSDYEQAPLRFMYDDDVKSPEGRKSALKNYFKLALGSLNAYRRNFEKFNIKEGDQIYIDLRKKIAFDLIEMNTVNVTAPGAALDTANVTAPGAALDEALLRNIGAYIDSLPNEALGVKRLPKVNSDQLRGPDNITGSATSAKEAANLEKNKVTDQVKAWISDRPARQVLVNFIDNDLPGLLAKKEYKTVLEWIERNKAEIDASPLGFKIKDLKEKIIMETSKNAP
jgi:hypothetical protein